MPGLIRDYLLFAVGILAATAIAGATSPPGVGRVVVAMLAGAVLGRLFEPFFSRPDPMEDP
jgi:TRAP-type C4-dicarboxylate transport system permease large subunit